MCVVSTWLLQQWELVNIPQRTSDLWANLTHSSFQLPIGIDFLASPARI